jgi:uncharacterized spore protein YtfJ
MTGSGDTAQDAAWAAESSTSTAADLLERLAGRLGGRASARAVFGEAVERDGVTVIPVAAAVFGFGGGTGQEREAGRSGDGGGGGAVARPIGFIEISGGTAVFKPVRDPLRDFLVPAVAVLAATGVARISRALFSRRRR